MIEASWELAQMADVEGVLREFVVRVSQNINSADDLTNVIVPLRYMISLLQFTELPEKSTMNGKLIFEKELDEIFSLCRDKATQAYPGIPSGTVLSRIFYNGACFAAFAELLLHKVALDWLACFSSLERAVLFDEIFVRCPLSEALPVLVQNLSLAQASEDDDGFYVHGSVAQAERSAQGLPS